MPSKQQFTLSSLLVLIVFSFVYISCNSKNNTDFNQDNVAEIKNILKDLDISLYSYRFVLPVMRDNKEVGSEVVGRLSVANIERIASVKNIPYTGQGNLQMILSDVPEGNGPSDHPACTACKSEKGRDVAIRIEEVIKNIPTSKYNFIR